MAEGWIVQKAEELYKLDLKKYSMTSDEYKNRVFEIRSQVFRKCGNAGLNLLDSSLKEIKNG